MNRDVETVLDGVYGTTVGWAAPLKIIEPRYIVKNIAQTNPYPGQENALQVTLAWNVDLFPRVRRCKQRAFKGWRQGERGFDVNLAQAVTHQQVFPEIADADRDTQKAGGGSGLSYVKVCTAARDKQFGTKHVAGTPCQQDSDCWLNAEVQNSMCVEATCHADEWVRPNITIQNMFGMAQLSGMRILDDFLGNGSTSVFGGQKAGSSGECFTGHELVMHAAEWCRQQSQLRLSLVNRTRAGVHYTFQFTLQNALLAQNSPFLQVLLSGGLFTGLVAMDKDLTRVLDKEGAEPGDAAPGKIYAIKFTYARIGQSTANPFAVNTITVTVATNLELQTGTKIGISPFMGSSMTGIDAFDSAAKRITLRGSNSSFFSAWVESTDYKHCGNFVPVFDRETQRMTVCPYLETANFDTTTKSFSVYNVRAMPAESSLVFSFELRNPGLAQESPELGISIEMMSQNFPRAAIVRASGDGAPLKVYGAMFRTKQIGQSVPYPSALNEIGVTISFNVPIPSMAQSRMTISGLMGAAPHGSTPDPSDSAWTHFPLRNVSDLEECTGLAREAASGWVGCNAFGIRGGGALGERKQCAGRWDAVSSVLQVDLLEDLAQDTEYAFIFTIRNPPREQLPATPAIQVQGYVPVLPKQLMVSDQSANLQQIDADVHDCATCRLALPQWYRWSGMWGREFGGGGGLVSPNVGLFPSGADSGAHSDGLPLKILRGSFLNVLDGVVRECGPGEPCGGWAWQSDPNPGSPNNVVTIKMGVSVPLLAAAGASIHVIGLRNAIKGEGVHPLYTPVETREIQISPDKKFEACFKEEPLQVSGEPGGVAGTWKWRQQDESANFHLLSDVNPGVWYEFRIRLQNPMRPQGSPAEGVNPSLRLQVRTADADPIENRLVNQQNQLKALEVVGPSFVVKAIAQETALPSANNRIIVTMATNVPLREGTCIRLSGFNDGAPLIDPEHKEIRLPYVNTTYSGSPWGQVAPTPADVEQGSGLGMGAWDGDMLQFCLREPTVELAEYVFSIKLTNPRQAQDPKLIRIETLYGLRIVPEDMDADARDEGRREPLRILQMRFIVSNIGQSTRFPGARNTITVTIGLRLPLITEMQPDFTLSGLTGTRTTSEELELGCVKSCSSGCTVIQCSRASPIYGECCGEAGASGSDHLITGTPCTVDGRLCATVRDTCTGPISDSNPGECCDTSLFSSLLPNGELGQEKRVNWDYASGTLSMRAIRDLEGVRNYTFSFQVENPVEKQAARQVSISALAAGSLLISPEPMRADASFPPLEVQEPGFLMAAAKQSNAYPCQENTITVTMALTVPVRKGFRIQLEGLDNAEYGTPEGQVWTELDLVDTPDPALRDFDVRGILTRVSEIFGYKLYKSVENGQEQIWMQAQGVGLAQDDDLIPAGMPFSFQYMVFNPRQGQGAPVTFQVRGFAARVGLNADFQADLSPVAITGCHEHTDKLTPEPGTAVALSVFSPRFDALRVAQSSSAPAVANIITVTFSTNVPLSRRCQIVITLSGLASASGLLPTYTQPGMAGTKWRSDSCPVPARDILTLEPAPEAAVLSSRSARLVTNVTLYGATPLDIAPSGRRFHARGGPLVSAPASCGAGRNSGILASCQAKKPELFVGNGSGWGEGDMPGAEGMCLYDKDLYVADNVREWQHREALLALFQGQADPSDAYSRIGQMPGLGDGLCDPAWDCSDYSWDLGDCLPPGSVADLDDTTGTAMWNEAHKSIELFLREDTEGYTEYAFSFQLRNPSRMSQSPDILMSTSGIVIDPTYVSKEPLPYPNAGSRGLCSTGGSLLGTTQGDLLPEDDATPLNTYSPSLIKTKIGASSNAPGAVNTISVTLAFNVLISPRLKMMLTVSGLKGAMWSTGLVELSSHAGHHNLFQSAVGGKIGYAHWDNVAKSLTFSVASNLKQHMAYSFSFNLVNPTHGQSRPTILIGSSFSSISLTTCPPWARPLSTRVKLRLFNTTELDNPDTLSASYPAAVSPPLLP